MINRYPGKCATCGARVGAEEGSYSPEDRKIFCKKHNPAATAVKAISVRFIGVEVAFAPVGFLGSEAFAAYQAACGGCRYDKNTRSQRAKPKDAAATIANLKKAGFEVDAPADVIEKMEAAADAPAVKDVILVRMVGGEVSIAPAAHLDDTFVAYQNACSGSRYDRETASQRSGVDLAPEILLRLTKSGFAIDVDPEVATRLEARAKERALNIVGAERRADEVDAILKKRGLGLFQYQREGSAWLASRQGGLLADDMGLGKTIQILTMLPDNASVVVVCPAVAKGVWQRETKRWRPDLHVTVLEGEGSFRWPGANEIVAINYDILPGDVPDTVLPISSTVNGPVTWIPSEITSVESASVKRAKKGSVVHPGESFSVYGSTDGKSPSVTSGDLLGNGTVNRDGALVFTTDPKEWASKPFLAVVRKAGPTVLNVGAVESSLVIKSAKDHFPIPAGARPGTILVADEGHNLANRKATRTKKYHAMRDVVREGGGRNFILTATPMKNKPPELWAVLVAAGLEREAFGNWDNFVRLFNGEKDEWDVMHWGDPEPEVAECLQRVQLRRIKKEVLPQLPPKTYRVVSAPIDRATAKAGDEALAILGQKGIDLEKAVEKLEESKLTFRELSAARAALAKAKFATTLELVKEYEAANEPVLVFSAFRGPVDLLGKRPGWAAITGDTDAEKRTAIEEAFQRGEYKGVACTIRAGGVAITLTRASNVIFNDQEWNPSLNNQAEDRAYRLGQTRGVLITRVVADHRLDQRIDAILAGKESLIDQSVDAARVIHIAPAKLAEVDWDQLEADARPAIAIARAAALEEAAAQSDTEREVAGRAKSSQADRIKRYVAEATSRRRKSQPEEEEPDSDVRRGPLTDEESWAANGIVSVAEADPDHAKEKNAEGFSQSDGGLGHSMAYLLGADLGLTPQEWRLCVELAHRYKRQIGPFGVAREKKSRAKSSAPGTSTRASALDPAAHDVRGEPSSDLRQRATEELIALKLAEQGGSATAAAEAEAIRRDATHAGLDMPDESTITKAAEILMPANEEEKIGGSHEPAADAGGGSMNGSAKILPYDATLPANMARILGGTGTAIRVPVLAREGNLFVHAPAGSKPGGIVRVLSHEPTGLMLDIFSSQAAAERAARAIYGAQTREVERAANGDMNALREVRATIALTKLETIKAEGPFHWTPKALHDCFHALDTFWLYSKLNTEPDAFLTKIATPETRRGALVYWLKDESVNESARDEALRVAVAEHVELDPLDKLPSEIFTYDPTDPKQVELSRMSEAKKEAYLASKRRWLVVTQPGRAENGWQPLLLDVLQVNDDDTAEANKLTKSGHTVEWFTDAEKAGAGHAKVAAKLATWGTPSEDLLRRLDAYVEQYGNANIAGKIAELLNEEGLLQLVSHDPGVNPDAPRPIDLASAAARRFLGSDNAEELRLRRLTPATPELLASLVSYLRTKAESMRVTDDAQRAAITRAYQELEDVPASAAHGVRGEYISGGSSLRDVYLARAGSSNPEAVVKAAARDYLRADRWADLASRSPELAALGALPAGVDPLVTVLAGETSVPRLQDRASATLDPRDMTEVGEHRKLHVAMTPSAFDHYYEDPGFPITPKLGTPRARLEKLVENTQLAAQLARGDAPVDELKVEVDADSSGIDFARAFTFRVVRSQTPDGKPLALVDLLEVNIGGGMKIERPKNRARGSAPGTPARASALDPAAHDVRAGEAQAPGIDEDEDREYLAAEAPLAAKLDAVLDTWETRYPVGGTAYDRVKFEKIARITPSSKRYVGGDSPPSANELEVAIREANDMLGRAVGPQSYDEETKQPFVSKGPYEVLYDKSVIARNVGTLKDAKQGATNYAEERHMASVRKWKLYNGAYYDESGFTVRPMTAAAPAMTLQGFAREEAPADGALATDESLYTIRPRFGVAGGPDIVFLTEKGNEKAFSVGAQVSGKVAEALQLLAQKGGEGYFSMPSTGSRVVATDLALKFDQIVWGRLRAMGYAERIDPVRVEHGDGILLTRDGEQAIARGHEEQERLLARCRAVAVAQGKVDPAAMPLPNEDRAGALTQGAAAEGVAQELVKLKVEELQAEAGGNDAGALEAAAKAEGVRADALTLGVEAPAPKLIAIVAEDKVTTEAPTSKPLPREHREPQGPGPLALAGVQGAEPPVGLVSKDAAVDAARQKVVEARGKALGLRRVKSVKELYPGAVTTWIYTDDRDPDDVRESLIPISAIFKRGSESWFEQSDNRTGGAPETWLWVPISFGAAVRPREVVTMDGDVEVRRVAPSAMWENIEVPEGYSVTEKEDFRGKKVVVKTPFGPPSKADKKDQAAQSFLKALDNGGVGWSKSEGAFVVAEGHKRDVVTKALQAYGSHVRAQSGEVGIARDAARRAVEAVVTTHPADEATKLLAKSLGASAGPSDDFDEIRSDVRKHANEMRHSGDDDVRHAMFTMEVALSSVLGKFPDMTTKTDVQKILASSQATLRSVAWAVERRKRESEAARLDEAASQPFETLVARLKDGGANLPLRPFAERIYALCEGTTSAPAALHVAESILTGQSPREGDVTSVVARLDALLTKPDGAYAGRLAKTTRRDELLELREGLTGEQAAGTPDDRATALMRSAAKKASEKRGDPHDFTDTAQGLAAVALSTGWPESDPRLDPYRKPFNTPLGNAYADMWHDPLAHMKASEVTVEQIARAMDGIATTWKEPYAGRHYRDHENPYDLRELSMIEGWRSQLAQRIKSQRIRRGTSAFDDFVLIEAPRLFRAVTKKIVSNLETIRAVTAKSIADGQQSLQRLQRDADQDSLKTSLRLALHDALETKESTGAAKAREESAAYYAGRLASAKEEIASLEMDLATPRDPEAMALEAVASVEELKPYAAAMAMPQAERDLAEGRARVAFIKRSTLPKDASIEEGEIRIRFDGKVSMVRSLYRAGDYAVHETPGEPSDVEAAEKFSVTHEPTGLSSGKFATKNAAAHYVDVLNSPAVAEMGRAYFRGDVNDFPEVTKAAGAAIREGKSAEQAARIALDSVAGSTASAGAPATTPSVDPLESKIDAKVLDLLRRHGPMEPFKLAEALIKVGSRDRSKNSASEERLIRAGAIVVDRSAPNIVYKLASDAKEEIAKTALDAVAQGAPESVLLEAEKEIEKIEYAGAVEARLPSPPANAVTPVELYAMARAAGEAGKELREWEESDEIHAHLEALRNARVRVDSRALEAAYHDGVRTTWKSVWTTAQAGYDGMGTKTVEDCGMWHGKALRRVAINPDHLDWQMRRYSSGIDGSWMEDPRVEDQRNATKIENERVRQQEHDARRKEGLGWIVTVSDSMLDGTDENWEAWNAHGITWDDARAEKVRRSADRDAKAKEVEWARCLAIVHEGVSLIDPGASSRPGIYGGHVGGRDPHVWCTIKIVRGWPAEDPTKANVVEENGDIVADLPTVAAWLAEGRIRVAGPEDHVPPLAVFKRLGHRDLERVKPYEVDGGVVWAGRGGRGGFGELLVLDMQGHLVRKKSVLEAVDIEMANARSTKDKQRQLAELAVAGRLNEAKAPEGTVYAFAGDRRDAGAIHAVRVVETVGDFAITEE